MKLKTIVRAIALLGAASPVFAQTPDAPQRVEITGSSIKRIASEGALPVQVISGQDMARRGLVTAEDLLRSLGANAVGADSATSNNNVFGSDTDRLTGGAAFANLRGLGPASTLVLVNGRRMVNHGMSGAAVDLNSIPTAAVERVEVLKDGASAIYGTDAIGGVVNFILKSDYEGVTIGGTMSQPLESSGGTRRRVTLTAGKGTLAKEGWNVLAALTLDKDDILRSSERSWADGYQPERGLTPNSSSHPFANIINVAGTALGSAGSVVSATDPTKYTRINLLSLQGRCDAIPTGVQTIPSLWNASVAANRYICNTDYGGQYMLAAPKEAYNLLARGALKLSATDTAFVEVLTSRTSVKAELTPTQFSTSTASGNHYPVNGPYYLNLKDYGVSDFDPTKPIAYRWRMQDFGNRVIENVADNQRLVAGIDGEVGAYSYKLGLLQARSEAWSNLIDGYAYSAKLNDALKTGVIDPWVMPGQRQSPEAMALIESTKARGRLQGGETGLTQFDGTLSGTWLKLPAGPLDFAVGFDLRRESYEFAVPAGGFTCVSTVSSTAPSTDVLLCPGNSPVAKQSRDIKAVYGELAVPVIKGLDLQLAVRHDDYGSIGKSTNPKVAFRWVPAQSVLFRGSANTGFRVPSFQQLALNTAPRDLTSAFNDPVKCATPATATDPTQCGIVGMDYTESGNPNLKPEKSKQYSLGLVVSPADGLAAYADYWQISLTDRIAKLTVGEVIANAALFPERFVRDASGNVSVINAGWINAAGSRTKGVDWGISYQFRHATGDWKAALDATYMISHKERKAESLPMLEYVGVFGLRTLYVRNKATASLTWTRDVWSATASANYRSRYLDQDMRAKGTMPADLNQYVASYTTTGLSASYTGFKGLTLTAGISNLFDRKPPFSHHDVDDVVGAGWDPRGADPFGRTLSLSFKYEFK